MRWIQTPWGHSFILVCVAFMVLMIKKAQMHGGLYQALRVITAQCTYDRPGHFHEDITFNPVLKWCRDANMEEAKLVMNHLRVQCQHMDACIAPEFGSDVAIACVGKQCMINPVRVHSGHPNKEQIECTMLQGRHQKKAVSVWRESPVIISYIDDKFKDVHVQFQNKAACIVHEIIDEIENGRG